MPSRIGFVKFLVILIRIGCDVCRCIIEHIRACDVMRPSDIMKEVMTYPFSLLFPRFSSPFGSFALCLSLAFLLFISSVISLSRTLVLTIVRRHTTQYIQNFIRNDNNNCHHSKFMRWGFAFAMLNVGYNITSIQGIPEFLFLTVFFS